MRKLTPHQISFNILNKVIFNNAHLSDQFNLYPEITPFSKALCFNTCRFFYLLKDILNQYIKKPLKSNPKTEAIETAIIMGLCQLIFMDIKQYAAVNETLNCLNNKKTQLRRGLANGVLRNYLKNNKNNKNNSQIIFDWINKLDKKNSPCVINKITEKYKNNAADIIKSMLEHPPMSIRINTNIISKTDYLAKLNKANIDITEPKNLSINNSLIINTPCQVTELPGFKNGEFSVQDLAAQYCINLLNPEPNDIILDACSAPGGKLSHIINFEPKIKQIIAIEKNLDRFKKLQNTLTRLKLDKNPKIKILNQDAINTNQYNKNKILFDKIIVDAPCSATGIIRRQPDVQIHRTEQDLELLIKTQSDILKNIWPQLKPGGSLLYITCSILEEENDLQIEETFSNLDNAEIKNIQAPFGQKTKYGWQTLPTDHKTDRFY